MYPRAVPVHSQIQRILRAKIASGEWATCERLPTEFALMRRFRVSRTTTRRALGALQADGLIVRRPRLGTFVSAGAASHRRRRVITNVVMGYEAEIRLVTSEEAKPPRQLLPFLRLSPGDSVCRFLRVEAIGAAPFSVVINYLPVEIGRRISRTALRRHSMFDLLQRRFRFRLGRIEQSLEARLPDEQVASLLEIDLTEPVLFSRLFVSDVRQRPVQVVDAFYRSDRTSYKITFPQPPHNAAGSGTTPQSSSQRNVASGPILASR